MKTMMIILVATLFISIGNAFAEDGSNIYKNVETDISGKIETTTIYEGEDGTYLNPIKQILTTFNDEGAVSERVIHTWNSNKSAWEASHKYTYGSNSEGQMSCTSYSTWDDRAKSWKTNK